MRVDNGQAYSGGRVHFSITCNAFIGFHDNDQIVLGAVSGAGYFRKFQRDGLYICNFQFDRDLRLLKKPSKLFSYMVTISVLSKIRIPPKNISQVIFSFNNNMPNSAMKNGSR